MRLLYPWAWIALPVLAGLAWLLRAQWRQRVGLDRAALALRALALAALVLALSGPQTASREPLRYLYFVVDRSASAALSERGDLLEVFGQFAQPAEHARYGLIVFGRDAYVDQPFSSALPGEIQTTVDPSGSDLEGALRLALETLPAEVLGPGQGNVDIVLLSDGQVDGRSLVGVLERARSAGIRIWVLPRGGTQVADLRVDRVQLPREVGPDRSFEGTAYVHATRAAEATLLVYRNDALQEAIDVSLTPGSNAIGFGDRLETPGHYRYDVRLVAAGDALLENNVASDLVSVTGEAALLVLEGDPAAGDALSRLLDAAGHRHERMPYRSQALRLSELAPYKSVILNNVPVDSLDAASIDALKAYVGELGGGLWVIEGARALAEVSESALEDLLPVTYEGPQREQLPGVAILFVLDRSSSMGQASVAGASPSKLDVLKEAAAASIEILREEDWIGIVTFDSSHNWLVPLQPLADAGNREAIYGQLQNVFSGGGTDLLPPLRDAFEQLQDLPARIKHVLVYSDGKTVRQDRDFESLFAQLSASDVTVSSIGLGQQPDEAMLSRLAEAGHGQVFLVRDVSELPKISVRETRRIVQRRWVVGEFQTQAGPFSALRLSGLDVGTLPPLGGYARTYAKPLSQTALSVEGNPLLSFWQYGLGQVAVLNSDLEGVWTEAWLDWPQLSELAAEVVSQLYANPASSAGLVLTSTLRGDTLHLELDALDGTRWVNQLTISGRLLQESASPAGQGETVSFVQIAPGRYAADVPRARQGLNLLDLEARSGAEVVTEQTQVVPVPYPQEYQHLGLQEDVLRQIAAATGGRLLEDERVELGPPGAGGPVRHQDAWPVLLSLALGLFLADLLLRKIPLDALVSRR